jgi:hypothetical protein
MSFPELNKRHVKEKHMNEQMKELSGIAVAAILAVDGLAHLYWATGNIWPAPDQRSLTQAVVNIANPQLLKPIILVPLACLLFGGALAVLARVYRLGILGQLIPAPLLQLSLLAIAAFFLLRGLAGIGWALGLLAVKSRPFYWLNLIIYTPACLLGFAAVVAVELS